MPDLTKFRALSAQERAIVSIAVLLDGHDASQFLMSDRERSASLSRAASDLADLPLELRLPLVGTLLREAVQELEASGFHR